MAASATVSQFPHPGNLVVPRHGVVTLFGYGINVHVHRGHLTIEDGVGAARRQARFSRVGHGIRRLVVVGSDGLVSLAALRWLADQDVAFSLLDRVGKVLAVTGPVQPSDARLRRAQSLAEVSKTGLQIAKELIRQKLIAQERLIRGQFQDSGSAETICEQRHALAKADSKEEIRRCEAHAALAYWSEWHQLCVMFPQADSRLVPDHWRAFGSRLSPLTRSPRLAVNPPNAALNYLYAILEVEARLAISELGLDPGIGFLHSDTRTRDSLACDLMEPVRPQVDAFVLDWLRREPWQKKWFFEETDGNCRLTSVFTARLSETSKTWRQALGPFAEWIARTLWSARSQPTSAKPPATGLTQNRKREAKGIPTSKLIIPAALRENHLTAPVPVRLNTHDPIAHARRASAQQPQAAARKAWNPTDRPAWLDEAFYREKIQPRVANMTISGLTSALRVARSYATNIRAGRRPHPRHWLTLAQLVDVAPGE